MPRISCTRSLFIRLLLAGLLGAAVGVAVAQNMPGHIDAACANDCGARGYDSEYCGKVCDLSDVERTPPDALIDFRCVSKCRDSGGNLSDCKRRCVVR